MSEGGTHGGGDEGWREGMTVEINEKTERWRRRGER